MKPKKQTLTAKPLFTYKARPKTVTRSINVYEAALDRMRWLFEEFEDQVQVSISGGKDSTVVMELAAMVAKERGSLPLQVMWLDQETEFQATVDYQRYIMYERDDLDFRWYQVPFLLENSTNLADPWLRAWDKDHPEDWIRPKEPGSIHDNTYGHDKFHELLSQIAVNDLTIDWCQFDGMRIEESPARRLMMTSKPMFKWCTWSTIDSNPKNPIFDVDSYRYRFHPIYDWKVGDIWKAIYDHGWRYNDHYNQLYRYGVAQRNMRVSNYHHESALSSLHWLQEVEPETWEAATRRLQGISTYGHLKDDQYPTKLPYMFSSWDEYAQFLIDNLAPPESRPNFERQYARLKKSCPHIETDVLAQVMMKTVIGNDLYGTAIGNFLVNHRKKKEEQR